MNGSLQSVPVVCKWLFSHMLLFFLDGWLNKVMNKNFMGGSLPGLILASTAYQLPHYQLGQRDETQGHRICSLAF
jgi:hypothetical protein